MSLALARCDDSFAVDGFFEDDYQFGPETDSEDFICWSLNRYKGWRTVMTTSFGMEGCALIDMYARRGIDLEVVYLDTGFFFSQTHDLINRMKVRYPNVTFTNGGTDLTPERQAEIHGERLWETNPDLCCKLRKVDPLARVMERADVWISGLRRTQSDSRSRLQMIEYDSRFEVVKLNPLTYWERQDIWDYVQQNDVPYNELHEQGFPSIGCTHCTRPVEGATPSEYTRLGRWSGSEKTECGLHLTP